VAGGFRHRDDSEQGNALVCATCGFPSAPGHWSEAGAATSHDRLRARFRRVQVLQRVLPSYCLSVHDDAAVPGMTVSTMTGNNEMVADLAALWTAAEKMSGRRIDPLDPAFLCDGVDDDGN
jgi:hypothetical protein